MDLIHNFNSYVNNFDSYKTIHIFCLLYLFLYVRFCKFVYFIHIFILFYSYFIFFCSYIGYLYYLFLASLSYVSLILLAFSKMLAFVTPLYGFLNNFINSCSYHYFLLFYLGFYTVFVLFLLSLF